MSFLTTSDMPLCPLTCCSWGFGSAFATLLLLLSFCRPPPLPWHMMEMENIASCRQGNTFNWFFLTEVFFIPPFNLFLIWYVCLGSVWVKMFIFFVRVCILHLNCYAVVHFLQQLSICYLGNTAAHGKGATPISLPLVHQSKQFHSGNCWLHSSSY